MYQIKWLPNAREKFNDNLLFWNEHNQSFLYSNKIIDAVEEILAQMVVTPFLNARFLKEEGVYRRLFLNGRFSLFYKIHDKTVYIVHFQSNSQIPYCEYE